MTELFIKPSSSGLLLIGDAERGARAVAQLSERSEALDDSSLTAWVGDILQDPTGRALLESVFSNSPFLTGCALADIPFLRQLLTGGPDTAFGQVIDFLKDDLCRETQEDRVMRELRIARRRVALLVALADVTEVWQLERVTQSLTDFADAALSVTISHLMLRAAEKGDLVLADPDFPEDGCGYVALAMGKQGARELNYSSDIDLIVLYEPLRVDYRGSRSLQQLFVRLTQRLVMILQQRTADGYVFRVDLRLRPDPSSTPVAIPYAAAQSYYASRGEDWERAAMIKARPAAGDTALGRRFLAELSPFIWRDHMDFWMIRDIQAIKRRINAQRGSRKVDFLGHNIKVGQGGIREIEFFAQTQQLIFGGKDAYLRCQRTVDALSTLAGSSRIDEQVADDLTEAYEFLRRLEHRLQMVDDQQTQTLPSDETEMLGVARLMGFREIDNFREILMYHLHRVEAHYNGLFEDAAEPDDESSVLFEQSEERRSDRLRDLGFRNLPHAVEQLGRCREAAARSERSQQALQLFQEFFPQAIETISRTADPNGTLDRFHDFLCQLTSRYSCFSALSANARLLDLLVEILAAAPAVADLLARHPDQLQAALTSDFFDVLPDRRLLRADCAETLGKSADIQQALEQTVVWANDQKFQVAVNVLRHAVDAGDAGQALTNIAEAVVHALSRRLPDQLGEQAGAPGSALVVVAIGACGRGELTPGSPLELLFLHDSDGSFHARLARRITNALSAVTAGGRLWQVDLKSTLWGAPGPLVSSIGAFRRYCTDGIGAGQLQALTTARAIAGPEQLRAEVEDVLHAALTRRRDSAMFADRIRELRERDGPDDTAFWQPRQRLYHRAECLTHVGDSQAVRSLTQCGEPMRFAMAAPIDLRNDFDSVSLRRLAKRTRDATQSRRLLALAEVYDGGSRTDASRIGGVGLQIIRDWVLRFNARGPDGLVDGKSPGAPSKLNADHRRALAEVVEAGPVPAVDGVVRWRRKDLARWLLETFAISLDETTVGRELKALGFAKISARPRHYAQNELAVEAFKKNFPAELAKIRARLPKGVEIELWWQDEARIGQKNKLTRRWARRGTRPRAPRDQRTEWAYIFGAICPAKGKGAGLVMPWCDTDAMAAHLIEISAAVDPGAHAVLIVDQAGWHLTPKLAIPDNITVLALPPRSPELNPVENVWQFMRDNWLSNRIFKSYEDIVALCCQAWNNLIDQPWKIMSLGMRKWAHGF